ncbi:MAG TPA: hypothetical protein VII41_00195, partial [Steroidobacteraceae bacterium]
GGSVQFEQENRVDAARVIALVQRPGSEYRLEGPLKLRITRALPKPDQRFQYAQHLLQWLSGSAP